FRWPSCFHSKNPLSGTMHRWRVINSPKRRLSNTVSLLALMVESFVVKTGSKAGTSCQRISSNWRWPLIGQHKGVLCRAKVVNGCEVEQVERLLAQVLEVEFLFGIGFVGPAAHEDGILVQVITVRPSVALLTVNRLTRS